MEKIRYKEVIQMVEIIILEKKQSETNSGILLPDDFKPIEERYVPAEVVSISDDVKFRELLDNGDTVIVDKSMIETINFDSKSINVVLENYILGIMN